MTMTVAPRQRKSEKLTVDEYRAFVKWVKEQPTKVDAAETVGISREVLDRVLLLRSGSPLTIGKVRLVLPKDGGADAIQK